MANAVVSLAGHTHRMARVNACTIVSRRELARARVLAATLHEHQPDTTLNVLLLDADPLSIGAVEHARVLALDDVISESSGLVAAANPPGALALAALPHLVQAMLNDGAASVIYLGAGQRVLGPLDELAALLADHQVVLVARATTELSAPTQAFGNRQLQGAFSRAALGLRAGPVTAALLSDWPRYFTVNEGDDGAAAVRAWLDALPAIVEDLGIVRDPGYGLDPWTLASRSVSGGSGVLTVGGHPARTLDLSEMDPSDASVSFDGPSRVHLSSDPLLAEVVVKHGEELVAAGYEKDKTRAPGFGQLEDGARLTPTMRALVLEAIEDGTLTVSPFGAQGRRQLYDYLRQPGDRGVGAELTRLHLAIWEARPDLQSAYPHIDGPDGAGFAGWLCVNGAEQEGLVPELLPPMPDLAYRDSNPHAHEVEPLWGVNVVGFFTAELGVGEAARLLMPGLDAASVPALPIQGHLLPASRRDAEFAYARIDDAAYPINIVCINGDGIPVFAREAGRSFFEGRYTIALWWWEVGDPPSDWSPAYEFVDEVWVASQHIYDAIAPTSPAPVVRVKLPVVTPEVAPRTRAALRLPEDGFVFLYVYDYHSVAARKNPVGLIDAFRRAFPDGSGAKLVLKSINANTRSEAHERVVLAASGRDDVILLDAYVSGPEKNAMIAGCDCYVSLHRSEGFGLTVAEAMLLGKPVIATRYGGTLEFMNDQNSYLVDWESTVVGEGAYPYAATDRWAEPDLDQAAALMRRVIAEPEEAIKRAGIARVQMLERHSPAVAGATMERRLALIYKRIQQEGARSLNLARLPSLQHGDAVPTKIANPPAVDWGNGRLGRLRWRANRPIADWARAYIEHESGIDTELNRAISRIDSRLREVAQSLQEQQKAQHAETLAMLRSLEARLAGPRGADDQVAGQQPAPPPAETS